MSNGPEVCCILPFKEKPQLVERAIGCFFSQDYQNKKLLLLNTGHDSCDFLATIPDINYHHIPAIAGKTVGFLRNFCINNGVTQELIAHFDYDDWSAPGRLSQQVALMEMTGRPVVGYYDMPFYDQVQDRVFWYDSLMRNYTLGTALMYRRELWEKIPFPDCTPEDTTWQRQVGTDNIAAISSLRNGEPMMIQTIHGSNGAAHSSAARFDPASPSLEKRVREIIRGV